MNLMLIRRDYPPVAIGLPDRKAYFEGLEHGSLNDDLQPFRTFMYERLDTTFDGYLNMLKEALPQPGQDC